MRFSALLATAALAAPALAAELQLNQYEGPTECDEPNKVKKGDYLKMHYTGTIDESSDTGEKGSKFDSSRDRNQEFEFQIGTGQVIQGWDQGIIGLCVGAKATLIIPPDMGYGAGGSGPIPGGATLNFDVEVVEIADGPPPPPNYFALIDVNKDGFLDRLEVDAFFEMQGQGKAPEELWEQEDKDKDGKISWEEFSGPKGAGHEEL